MIDDETYGYQKVNVEAQTADPDSLFNWMQWILAERKKHPIFGRGSLELVDAGNPSMLAHVREYEGEKVLVLHNLADHPQHDYLRLPQFAGYEVTNLLSGDACEPFSAAGVWEAELPRYGYRWLALKGKSA